MRGIERSGVSAQPARCRAVILIEAVLYISVAFALIVGGLVFFQQASLSARVNNQVRVLSSIMVEIRALLNTSGWQITFDGGDIVGLYVLDDVLIASGSVPGSIINPSPVPPGWYRLRNEWNGDLQLFTDYDDASRGNVLELTLWGGPVAACARLVTKDASGSGVLTDGILDTRIVRDSSEPGPAPNISLPRGTNVTPEDASNGSCLEVGGNLKAA